MTKTDQKKSIVRHIVVSEDDSGQRIDNFLTPRLKGVPRSHLYRILRKGEIRVNSKRISACYRLNAADRIRIPPLYLAQYAKKAPPDPQTLSLLDHCMLYEDERLMVVNKPVGLAVHGGSTVRLGLIDLLRYRYPQFPQLELAHRLDSDTSGCLLLAKNKRILRELHALLRDGKIKKSYLALTRGQWSKRDYVVTQPLQKQYASGGKQRVIIHAAGKAAKTIFRPIRLFSQATLVSANLLTGRTHQIRVHAASVGHPIAGDERYGEEQFNRQCKTYGLKRLFLHAKQIEFMLPSTQQHIIVEAPLEATLEKVLSTLEKAA